jgi:hypothetical protein
VGRHTPAASVLRMDVVLRPASYEGAVPNGLLTTVRRGEEEAAADPPKRALRRGDAGGGTLQAEVNLVVAIASKEEPCQRAI